MQNTIKEKIYTNDFGKFYEENPLDFCESGCDKIGEYQRRKTIQFITADHMLQVE